MTFIKHHQYTPNIKKDPEREVEKNPNYSKFVDLVLNKIRFAPGREFIDISYQKRCRDSYGIILYYANKDDPSEPIQYMCAKTKNTYEYYIFITGRYNDKQLWTIFSLMTRKERERILSHINNFRLLWDDLWVNHRSRFYRDDYPRALKIFNQIKEYIPDLIKWSYSSVHDTEWVWPKGQKDSYERTDADYGALRAAVREFREETRINLQVDLTQSYHSFTETYLGSNNFVYNTTYFVVPVAHRLKAPEPLKKEKGIRKECLSYDFEKIDWFTAKNAPVNARRKDHLLKIDTQLKSEIYK